MSINNEFNKRDLNRYLNELSKVYKKLGGRKYPCELIIVGGASIVLNYNFRTTTTDIDAFGNTHCILEEAIKIVEKKFNLNFDWLNTDFKLSESFSNKIVEVSAFYKTFNQVLNVRTINRSYLIAMKLASFRNYKYDKSDIIGVLIEEKKFSKVPITLSEINNAIIKLYGDFGKISDDAKIFIKNALKKIDDNDYYNLIRNQEEENKKEFLEYNCINKKRLTPKQVKEITEKLEKTRLNRRKYQKKI